MKIPAPHCILSMRFESPATFSGYIPAVLLAQASPIVQSHPVRREATLVPGDERRAAKIHIHRLSFPSCRSTSHLRIPIAPLLIRRDPQHIVTPNQHLPQLALVLALDVLDSAAELDVHVRVDADEAAGVLGLAPLEADTHVVVDEGLQHGPRVHGDELCREKGS